MAARAFCRGDEEAGLFAREAAYAVLQQMYTTVPPVTIKDCILAAVGGNKVRSAPQSVYVYPCNECLNWCLYRSSGITPFRAHPGQRISHFRCGNSLLPMRDGRNKRTSPQQAAVDVCRT